MLTILSGPAGAGKTQVMLEKLREHATKKEYAWLIVPEQSSFNYQKLISLNINKSMDLISSYSFSSLSKEIIRKYGHDKRNSLDDTSACFFMSLALDNISKDLSFYKRHYNSKEFVEKILDTSKEFDSAGVSFDDLLDFSNKVSGPLSDKAKELSLILSKYKDIWAKTSRNEKDDIEVSCEIAEKNNIFKDKNIFIDDFSGFTAPQFLMIEEMLKSARNVTVGLMGNGVVPAPEALKSSEKTAYRLINLAKKNNIEVKRINLEQSGSLKLPSEFIESMMNDTMPKVRKAYDNIHFIKTRNPMDEAECVAFAISKIVKDKGYRYKDISVVAKTKDRLRDIKTALDLRNIPYFMDLKTDSNSSLFLQGIKAAVHFANEERDANPLLLIKNPLLGLNENDISKLENYCFIWSVKVSSWKNEFNNNPEGLGELTDKAKEEIEKIEALRKEIMVPILKLKQAINSKNGLAFAKGVVTYLDDIKASNNLIKFSYKLSENQRTEFLQQQSLLWDELMNILDIFASLPSDYVLKIDQIISLFDLTLSGAKVALPPKNIDEVTVGEASRMRIGDAKVVFIMDAIQGEFPSYKMPDSLLTEKDRKTMVENGLELISDSDDFLEKEKLMSYAVTTAANEELFVSCPQKEMDGTVLTPSEIFDRAKALGTEFIYDEFDDISNNDLVLRSYAKRNDLGKVSTLKEIGKERNLLEKIDKIDDQRIKKDHEITDIEIAKKLFGEDRIMLSPTGAESFSKCPFTYYMKKGLNIMPLKKAKFTQLETGTLLHEVVEKLVQKYDGIGLKDVKDQDLKNEISKIIDDYISLMAGDKKKLTKRTITNMNRLGDLIFDLLKHFGEEFSQSAFKPIKYELPIAEDSEVKPLKLKTFTGEDIIVTGKVDRADVAEINGKKYIRIIDYKTSGKKFLLNEVFYGINMQMLIYLESIRKNGENDLKDLLPAGILYVPLVPFSTTLGSTSEDEIEKAERNKYQSSGLLLYDEDVLTGMDKERNGLYIPNTKTARNKDFLASMEQMGIIGELIEQKLTDIGNDLLKGKIKTEPKKFDRDDTSCKYCDYKYVCGFEKKDGFMNLEKITWDKIEGKEN